MLGRQYRRPNQGQVNKATIRFLEVLAAYIHRSGPFGVTELSQELKISKNMAFRALNTLLEEGFVLKDASGSRYELGFGVLALQSLESDGQFDIRTLCAPFLQRMHRITGESVFLSVIVGRNHVTIDSVEPQGVRVSHSPRGLLVPLHASPASRTLLSFLGDEEIAEYIRVASPMKRFTPTTITDPERLWEEVRLVRSQGFARGYRDHYAHATYVSFPVLDTTGRPHAAFTIGGPPDRFTDADVDRLLPQMFAVMRDLNIQSALHPSELRIVFE
jgi:DNA-binding IclR family transcriptional regulator